MAGAIAESPLPVRAATSGLSRHACHAMGTRFELLVGDVAGGRAAAMAEAAFERILELHARWSRFQKDSLVSRVNALAGQRPVRVDKETFALLSVCREVYEQSGGAFDPAYCGAAHRGACNDFGVRLEAAQCTVEFTRPEISLDFGAVAKGYALDAAAAVLRDLGVASAFIHGGTSSALAIGCRPDGSAWRVRAGPWAHAPVVTLSDRALSVSAQHGRAGHIVDPRTGVAVADTCCACTLAPTGVLADGWSTAVLVLGHLPTGAPEQVAACLVHPDAAIGSLSFGRWPDCRSETRSRKP